MKTLALILFATSSAVAGQPYCGVTYHKPAVAYAPPVQHVQNVTNNNYPPPVFIGIPVPISYAQPLALQGGTKYSYSSFNETYGNGLDLALLADRAVRLGEQAGETQRLVIDGTTSIIREQQAARNDGARIAQAVDAAVRLIEADNAAPQQQTEFTLKSERFGTVRGKSRAQPQRLGATANGPNAVLSSRCVSCHGETYKDWESLDYDTQVDVFDHVNSSDPSIRMPRKAGGKEAGEPLTLEEKLLLVPRRK